MSCSMLSMTSSVLIDKRSRIGWETKGRLAGVADGSLIVNCLFAIGSKHI
jgi:hypothetical protein